MTLFCDATGVPKPSLKWTKDDSSTVLSESANLTLYTADRPGNPNETVKYRCTATNGYGDHLFKTDTSTVTVICEYYYCVLAITTGVYYILILPPCISH